MRPPIRLSLCAALLAPALGAQPAPAAAPLIPFKGGDHYFFADPTGALYTRDDYHGRGRLLLPAGSYGVLAPSWNGAYLAYSPPGTTLPSDVRILDVRSGHLFPEVLHDAVISHSPWTANNKGLFYARLDTATHLERVYYHRLGRPQQRDEVIYSDPDHPDWQYEVRVSDDGQYAIFTVSHPQDDHTRLYFVDLDDPGSPDLHAPVVKLVDEFDARYTFIDNGGEAFFLQTNRVAPRGRVVLANTQVTRESRWPPVIPESADTLQYVRTAGDDYVLAVYRHDSMSVGRIYGMPDQSRMREELRRRADSARAVGDRSGVGTGTPVDEMPFGFRLVLQRLVPTPAGATLLGMTSTADDPEILYTVRLANGTLRTYVYNVKERTNEPFDTGSGASAGTH